MSDVTGARGDGAFLVTAEEVADGLLIRGGGEVDPADRAEFDRLLRACFSDGAPAYGRVVADLSAVTYLCIGGFRTLLSAQADARRDGIELHLAAPEEHVVTHIAAAALPPNWSCGTRRPTRVVAVRGPSRRAAVPPARRPVGPGRARDLRVLRRRQRPPAPPLGPGREVEPGDVPCRAPSGHRDLEEHLGPARSALEQGRRAGSPLVRRRTWRGRPT
ncbi:MAG: hypothetical protein ABS81_02250 [Pseudonocardia sp. SCN 72-86]|nr:MAG: hypothetical protein ABS81_02250 [Pseudonocardia sp. SCN 72-86]